MPQAYVIRALGHRGGSVLVLKAEAKLLVPLSLPAQEIHIALQKWVEERAKCAGQEVESSCQHQLGVVSSGGRLWGGTRRTEVRCLSRLAWLARVHCD
jgi:hypothetical protein